MYPRGEKMLDFSFLKQSKQLARFGVGSYLSVVGLIVGASPLVLAQTSAAIAQSAIESAVESTIESATVSSRQTSEPASGSTDSPINANPINAAQLVQTGKGYYQTGHYAAAASAWQQAAQGFAEQRDIRSQVAVLSNLALAHQQLGNWGEANQAIAASLTLLDSARDAVQSAQPSDAAPLKAQILTIQGSLQLAQGRVQAALETWQTATKVSQQAGDSVGTTRDLIHQSQALRSLGLYPRAKSVLAEVHQTLQAQPDSLLKAAVLVNYGDALRLVGEFTRAETVLQQGLAIAQWFQSPADIALAHMSLGNIARAQQKFPIALKHYQQAADVATTPMAIVQAQLNQLHIQLALNQPTQSAVLIASLQPQVEQLPASRMGVYARVNFVQNALKAQRIGRVQQGMEHWGTETQPQKIQRIQHSKLKAQNSESSSAGALQAKIQDPKSKIQNLTALGQILATGIAQAQQMSDPRAESYATGQLAGLYEQSGQLEAAHQLTEKALGLAQMSNAAEITYLWQWQLGRIFKAQGKLEEAIATYNQAVQTLNSIRNDLVASNPDLQFSFRESVEPVYRQFVSLLLTPASATTGTSQANLKKARAVIESLQLAELDNYFREACLTQKPAQADQVDPQSAMLYPIILPDRLEVVLSIPGKPLHHYASPVSPNELDDLTDQMRRSLRLTSTLSERMAISQRLYDLLIRPALPDLAANRIQTLAFVLDGSLKNIPMAALHDGKQFLVEQYSIAVTPGLQLIDPRPLQRQQLKVLVGGLSEERQGFSALPGVKTEVQQIKAEIPSHLLLNQTFTTATFQSQVQSDPFQVVHLATHGQFSSNASDTFVLTWDERLDVKQLGQLLQTRAQQTRPIELLVLSACQTAEGDNRAALGLAGVAVRSGARSTLATLWSVDDQATSKLMVPFYQELGRSGNTKAEALRQAQLKLLQNPDYQHPFFWAPFVLIGNWL
jgi:CHAT domain-containing protein